MHKLILRRFSMRTRKNRKQLKSQHCGEKYFHEELSSFFHFKKVSLSFWRFLENDLYCLYVFLCCISSLQSGPKFYFELYNIFNIFKESPRNNGLRLQKAGNVIINHFTFYLFSAFHTQFLPAFSVFQFSVEFTCEFSRIYFTNRHNLLGKDMNENLW